MTEREREKVIEYNNKKHAYQITIQTVRCCSESLCNFVTENNDVQIKHGN